MKINKGQDAVGIADFYLSLYVHFYTMRREIILQNPINSLGNALNTLMGIAVTANDKERQVTTLFSNKLLFYRHNYRIAIRHTSGHLFKTSMRLRIFVGFQ
jgi:hypothetical protein